jgi:hypothetical protein
MNNWASSLTASALAGGTGTDTCIQDAIAQSAACARCVGNIGYSLLEGLIRVNQSAISR